MTIRLFVLALVAALALGLAACGDDDNDTTVTATEEQTVQEEVPETVETTEAPTTTTATGPDDCNVNEGEIYSQVSGTCVEQRSGDNPCPPGEIAMADEAVCVKE